MTPAARVQTAIELLDEILSGAPAEKTLTSWARRSRFAGSKDRAAVRDHVYDVLRNRNSCVALAGGALNGRALMIGLLHLNGVDPQTIFTGQGYAPSALEEDEIATPDNTDVVNLPEWIVPHLQASLGESFAENEALLRDRAPVILRVNTRVTDVKDVSEVLENEGIIVKQHVLCSTAFEVLEGPRRVAGSASYQNGLVELQDAASQAAMHNVPMNAGDSVLDYCAGGGGKSLALAARIDGRFFAHDIEPRRMRDLDQRAKRAGVEVVQLSSDDCLKSAPYDVVLADVPCSGTGSWRRDPDAKWRFTSDRLSDLNATQDEILDQAAELTSDTGLLVYATCSLLAEENLDRVHAFLNRAEGWKCVYHRQFSLLDGGDGFFVAHLTRNEV